EALPHLGEEQGEQADGMAEQGRLFVKMRLNRRAERWPAHNAGFWLAASRWMHQLVILLYSGRFIAFGRLNMIIDWSCHRSVLCVQCNLHHSSGTSQKNNPREAFCLVRLCQFAVTDNQGQSRPARVQFAMSLIQTIRQHEDDIHVSGDPRE